MPPHANTGHLYVIEFSTGAIKVGESRDPIVRIEAHRKEARRFGVSIARSWLSESARLTSCAERRLITACHREAVRLHGYEYLSEIAYERCIELALTALAETAFSLDDLERNGFRKEVA
jgi:hypothetical protein